MNKTWVSAQMSEGLAARLKEVAKDSSITRSELVRRACELYLASNILEDALDHASLIRTSHGNVN